MANTAIIAHQVQLPLLSIHWFEKTLMIYRSKADVGTQQISWKTYTIYFLTIHLINLPMLIHDIVKIGEFIGPTLKGKKLWDKKPKKCPKTFKCFYAFLSLLV